MAQDDRDEIVGYGAGDAHRRTGLMAVVGAYEDAEAESGEVGGVSRGRSSWDQTAPRQRRTLTLKSTSSSIERMRSCPAPSSAKRSRALTKIG
ncbi:hypothetical protein [Streptomyces zinciresistens]|nr:hypothetical protein [Streptomyces zinciresistens]